MTSRNIRATIPVLASLSIDETVHFYSQRLGFEPLLAQADYAIMQRDGAELHFWLCRERHIAENTSCYIRVDGTQGLYEEFLAKGLNVQPPAEREWGMKELYVIDPHGNLIKFGEPTPPPLDEA